jgi:hypothetical protein
MAINMALVNLVDRNIARERECDLYVARCICYGMSAEEIKASLPERSVICTLNDLLDDTLAHIESIREKSEYKK